MLDYTNLKIDNVDMWGENELVNGGIRIYWSSDKIGFGELTIYKDKNNKIVFDTECMSKDFVKAVLDKLVEIGEIT